MKRKRISFLLVICLFIASLSNITFADNANWNAGAKINFQPYLGQTTYKTSTWFELNTQDLGLEAYEDLSANAVRWDVFAGILRTYQSYLKDTGYNQLSANGATISQFADAASLEPNAQNEAKIMVGIGMLSGEPVNDQLFMNMSSDITRGEVAKILACFYQTLNPIQEQRRYEGFSDTAGHWAEEYIRYCYERNLLDGRGIEFAPDDNITKEEAIQILLNMKEDSIYGVSLSNIAKALNETYYVVSLYYDTSATATSAPNSNIPITPTEYSYNVAPGDQVQVTLKYSTNKRIEVTAGTENIRINSKNTSFGTMNIIVEGIYTGDSYIRCRYQDSPYYEDLYIPIFVKSRYSNSYTTKIDLRNTTISLNAGSTYNLTNNFTVNSSNYNYNRLNLYYSSSNPKIATVDFNSGIITARTRGSCYIYILGDNVTKRVRLNVSGSSSSVYPDNYYPNDGYYYDFGITEYYGQLYKGNTLNLKNKVYNQTGEKLKFSSTNTQVATVTSTGIITAKSVGYTTIIITCGNKRLEYQLQVIGNSYYDDITQIYLVNSESTTIAVGEEYELDYDVEVYPYFADRSQLRYKSSNTSVAKVNSRTGVITGVSSGTATITVYSDYANCYFYVYVDDSKVRVSDILVANPTVEVGVNNFYDLSKDITVIPTNATNKLVSYTSDNTDIAYVSPTEGIINGITAGETNITIEADGVKKRVKVIVKESDQEDPNETPIPTVKPTPKPDDPNTTLAFSVNMIIQLKEGQDFNPYSVLIGNIEGVSFSFSEVGYARIENGRVIGVTKSRDVFYLIATNKYGKTARLPMKVI